jgi:Restriction endonuclease BglII
MRIAETYSHLNGLEFLLIRRKELWDEVREVISHVDAAACRTKISKEQRSMGELKYSPQAMIKRFASALTEQGWGKFTAAGQIFDYNQTDFVKDRVAIEVQFGKYAFVAYDLFVKHLAFYIRDEIDVGIEILPMKSIQQEMSSGPGYYEGELYNVIRNGRGVPGVPLVMIGAAL